MSKEQYKWDLEALLQNQTLEELFDQWEALEKELVALYPDFYKSLANFKNWIAKNEQLKLINNRLSNYLSNNLNENLADPYFNGWMQKYVAVANQYSVVFANIANVIIKHKEQIYEYLKDPELRAYQLMIDRIIKNEKYTLSDEQEKLYDQLSQYTGGFEDIFATLTDSDLKFAPVKDSKNKTHKIKTQADVFKYLKSHDEQLRKNTWYSFNHAFLSIKNTLVQSLYYNYLMLNTNAKVRGFSDYITMTAYADEIDVDFIKFVYENVKGFKDNVLMYKKIHSAILKKMFKLKKLHPWDSGLELTKKQVKYTIPQAQSEVLEALAILGDEYVEKVKEAFANNWISWLPAAGKQTGAYSIGGTKGIDKYYISMNFDETLRSVYTVIHELGHSMNSYYTDKTQAIYDGTSIFYAEVASICNEMLLNYHLLKKYDDKKLQLMIYDEMISNFIATTSRQVIFSAFEYQANEVINKNQPFTLDMVLNTYQDLCNEYVGAKKTKNKKQLELLNFTPLRIPHFYVGNFYVYKYAIGQVAAILIADDIYHNPEAKNKLFTFLSSGSSKTPLETIKLLGVDLSQKATWQKAQAILKSWIDEYQKLAKQLKYVK